MKISVALCTYNGAKYILQQLESIAQQTVRPAEIVVCDEGSGDGTVDIIKQFSSSCSIPIRIYINEEVLGVTCNFKKAIGLCSGETIALCDQDDVWLPNNLEEKLSFLGLKENRHINVVFSDLQLVDQELQLLPFTMWEKIGFTRARQRQWKAGHALDVLIKRGNVVTGASVVFRTSFRQKFVQYLGLSFSGLIHDAILAVIAAKDESIQFIEPITVYYRQHPEQQFGSGEPFQLPPFTKRAEKIWRNAENVDPELENISMSKCRSMEDLLKLDVPLEKLSFIGQTIKHIKRRRKIIRRSRLARIFPIAGEFFSLRYKRFSGSLILQPLRDLANKKITNPANKK